MSKKVVILIVIGIIVVLAAGGVGFALLSNGIISDEQQSQQSEVQEQNQGAGGLSSTPDNTQSSNIGDEPANTLSPSAEPSTPPVPSSDTTTTTLSTDITTSVVGQELQPIAIDMVSNGFVGSNFSNYAGTVSDIPSALHTEDNWAYLVATGADIGAILGGAERINVQVENVKVMSSTPQDTLYQVIYRFTAHHTEAMAMGDEVIDRPGVSTALVRVNSQGKVIQYEESVEW